MMRRITLLLAVVGMTVLGADVRATTTLSGAACQAYQGINEGNLIRSFLGCYNVATSTTIVTFGENRNNQPVNQTLYLGFAGTAGNQNLLCNAYLYPYDGGPAIWSKGFTASCNTSFNEFAYSVPGDYWGNLTVYCQLPTNCRIIGTEMDPG